MSELLKNKQTSLIDIPFRNVDHIQHGTKQSFIFDKKGNKFLSKCIGCKNHYCMKFQPDEIKVKGIQFPFSADTNVCPTNAMKLTKNGTIFVDYKKCIACGLCAIRCPIGCIHLDGVAKLEREKNIINEPTEHDINCSKNIEHEILIAKLNGSLIELSKDNIANFLHRFDKLNHEIQFADLLVRNVLLQLGCSYGIRRKGDNIFRIDGIASLKNKIVVNEVELSDDVLEAPRSIMDDVCIFKYKFNEHSKEVSGLITLRSFPNKRAEIWNVINDIKEITGLKIDIVTIGTLMFLLWNNSTIDLSKDVFWNERDKNRSILKKYGVDLKKFEDGFESIFEPKK